MTLTFNPERAMITRYDTRCHFNVRSKADMRQLNLPHGTKDYESEKKAKGKKGYAQKYRQTGRGICGVSPD